jgi:hypothetical protein
MDAVKAVYGDPKDYLLIDGGVDPDWERAILDYVYLPEPVPLGWDPAVRVARIRIHRKLVNSLSNVFNRIRINGYWPMIQSFDGTYAWRAKRTSPKLSLHCWGAAIDLNAGSNPLGGLGDMPWQIINCFNQEGWEWGGEWRYADPMHFQAATGC